MGIFAFFSNLFGGGETTVKSFDQKKVQKKVEENVENEAENEEETEEEAPWWECPVQRKDSVEFEALSNTVLYDELNRSLTESRLEIIEIPDNISAILDIIHRKNFKYDEITELIQHSPVLTGDFLSISNSAAFSRGIAIRNLAQALPRLGKQTIQSILFLNASKMTVPNNPIFQKTAEEIILESQAVAKICRMMGEKFYGDGNEAFLAGLLHNIGKLGLLKQIANFYEVPEDLDMEYHQSLFANIFPMFYQEAGEIIGKYWKLEEHIIQSISHHNKLEELIENKVEGQELKIAALVNLSVYMAKIMGFGDSAVNEADLFGQQAAEIIGLSDNASTRKLLNEIHEAVADQVPAAA
ncbi:MAG: HDOD domain-containing protein [Lentisphaeraceae bacterium]|nr:HDOD domain-containing protein [Lentisphaeraceae bacterium]